MRTRLFASLALLSSALLVGSGCAALRAASAKQNYIRTHSADYTFQKPLAQVWPEARALLFEQGFQVKDTGEGATTLETDWAYKGQTRVRYLAQGIAVSPTTCQVHFTKNSQTGQGSLMSDRDLDMEWYLIRRVAPNDAQKIEADAEAAGQAAANAK